MKILRYGIIACVAIGFISAMPISVHACKITEEMLKKFDANGDGKLDKTEKQALHASKKGSKKEDANKASENATPSNPSSGPVNPL